MVQKEMEFQCTAVVLRNHYHKTELEAWMGVNGSPRLSSHHYVTVQEASTALSPISVLMSCLEQDACI